VIDDELLTVVKEPEQIVELSAEEEAELLGL
jgi:hypothetical protein